ncbi:hypothetical protein LTS15_006073 [Exophiala xenobiotica]|nr:hypothetical protein LTS15_006073 [Exophiala xenobiotica]
MRIGPARDDRGKRYFTPGATICLFLAASCVRSKLSAERRQEKLNGPAKAWTGVKQYNPIRHTIDKQGVFSNQNTINFHRRTSSLSQYQSISIMSYDDEHYAEHEHLGLHLELDMTQQAGGDGYGDADDGGDGGYGGHNGYYGDEQQDGHTNSGHGTGQNGEDDEDDGARWPHADKTKADLDMLIEYALAQASAAGLDVNSDGDEDEYGEHDDYNGGGHDDQHDDSYGDGETGQYDNDHGHGGAADDGMW